MRPPPPPIPRTASGEGGELRGNLKDLGKFLSPSAKKKKWFERRRCLQAMWRMMCVCGGCCRGAWLLQHTWCCKTRVPPCAFLLCIRHVCKKYTSLCHRSLSLSFPSLPPSPLPSLSLSLSRSTPHSTSPALYVLYVCICVYIYIHINMYRGLIAQFS